MINNYSINNYAIYQRCLADTIFQFTIISLQLYLYRYIIQS